MNTNFDACLASVLQSEGGFVNDPADPGGATNHGVTKRTWEAYVGHSVSVDDIKALTVADVGPLYRQRYWAQMSCDDWAAGVDLMAFDFGVNAGPTRSLKTLQQAVGVTADGVVGSGTRAAVAAASPRTVIATCADLRDAYYHSLPTFARFGKGWLARVDRVAKQAVAMAGGA
jgi:lysozyme family protein